MTSRTEFFAGIDTQCLDYLSDNVPPPANSSHDQFHWLDVASDADIVAKIYHFNLHERGLLRISAWFHDAVRTVDESKDNKDAQLSAYHAVTLLERLSNERKFLTTDEERRAVSGAIQNHRWLPPRFKDPATREVPPETLAEKLTVALFVADKLTQNGVWVIARRSDFVGGDKLRSEELQQYGFRPKSSDYSGDEAKVVMLESAVRLTLINPENSYPKILTPIVNPLYDIQRHFVNGICRATGINTLIIARSLLEVKNRKGNNMLQERGLEAPDNPEELKFLIESVGGITNPGILSTSHDLSMSALEAVGYFSLRSVQPLQDRALSWRPRWKAAQTWQKMMASYLGRT